MDLKYYKCNKCGQIITIVDDKGLSDLCCGNEMSELIPNSSGAIPSEHIPLITIEGNKVSVFVSSNPHPMISSHFIMWISILTNKGNQRKLLAPNEEPKAIFLLEDNEEIIKAYAYCNLHLLWKSN